MLKQRLYSNLYLKILQEIHRHLGWNRTDLPQMFEEWESTEYSDLKIQTLRVEFDLLVCTFTLLLSIQIMMALLLENLFLVTILLSPSVS
jgi:hypothetical protein